MDQVLEQIAEQLAGKTAEEIEELLAASVNAAAVEDHKLVAAYVVQQLAG